MMAALPMMITNAGIDAIVDAQNGETAAVVITQVGLTSTPFIMAPTVDALPGEFKRIESVSGESAGENIIHLTAYDADPVSYDVTGFGLYADDGTLVAIYSSDADPILSKAALAVSLLAVDIAFSGDMSSVIEFGDALFLYPPATEDMAGVAKLATEALADEGEDDQTIMTPSLVKRMIAAALDAATTNIIRIFWGATEDIPAGWQLCDGTNGTPDLRDKFIIGAGGTYEVSQTGGAATHDHGGATQGHALSEAEMPAHKHSNGVTDQSGVAFNHGTLAAVPGTSNSMATNNNNGTTEGWTSTVGGGAAHDHDIDVAGHLPPYFALAFIMKA